MRPKDNYCALVTVEPACCKGAACQPQPKIPTLLVGIPSRLRHPSGPTCTRAEAVRRCFRRLSTLFTWCAPNHNLATGIIVQLNHQRAWHNTRFFARFHHRRCRFRQSAMRLHPQH